MSNYQFTQTTPCISVGNSQIIYFLLCCSQSPNMYKVLSMSKGKHNYRTFCIGTEVTIVFSKGASAASWIKWRVDLEWTEASPDVLELSMAGQWEPLKPLKQWGKEESEAKHWISGLCWWPRAMPKVICNWPCPEVYHSPSPASTICNSDLPLLSHYRIEK